jgi:hypothetical protein
MTPAKAPILSRVFCGSTLWKLSTKSVRVPCRSFAAALNESQRAMIAARLANMKVGHVASQREDAGRIQSPLISTKEAAEMLNVGRHGVVAAKKVLSEGTPAEIAAIERGEASVSTVAHQIRKGTPPEKRKAKRDAPLAQTGKNPERILRGHVGNQRESDQGIPRSLISNAQAAAAMEISPPLISSQKDQLILHQCPPRDGAEGKSRRR